MTELRSFFEGHDHVVRVEIAALKGSSPRERGATIYVSTSATLQTIGGGQLEYLTIDEARRMVRQGQIEKKMTIPLGPEIGQCCGGVVELSFNQMDDAEKELAIEHEKEALAALPCVYIFGAGHVGRALAASLHLLPTKPIVIDSRKEELNRLTVPVETRCTPLPEADIKSALKGSIFVILTHDHALDFLLAREALLRGDAAYVGMIGSKSKRAVFANWLRREMPQDFDIEACLEHLVCPIGAGLSSDKRPSVIAALVTAEIVSVLESSRSDEHFSIPSTE